MTCNVLSGTLSLDTTTRPPQGMDGKYALHMRYLVNVDEK